MGLVLIAVAVATAVAFVATTTFGPPAKHTVVPPPVKPADVTVDFGAVTQTLGRTAIGIDESTYGTPTDVSDQTAQRLLRKLGVGYARLAVTMSDPANPKSRVICAATGCNPAVSVSTWIQAMESMGETPLVEITPDTLSPADAAAIVRHFDGTASAPIVDWIIGNEPNIVESAATYSKHFNSLYDAMKAVDPWIQIGGPATLGFDQPFISTFLADSGSRADFVDFHFYPGQETQAQLLAELPQMSADLSTLRQMIDTEVPDRAASIGIHVGEWNISADNTTLGQFAYSGFASVFDADLIGRMLAGGADSLAWGSKNGPMSVVYGDGTGAPAAYTPDTPMPLYEAIGMFTGQGLFPRFSGSVVSATSVLPTVDAFASAAPDEIVLVNKGTAAERVTLRVSGSTLREAMVWQLQQAGVTPSPPRLVGHAVSTGGLFHILLPGDSVSTLVMTALVATTKPSPASSAGT